MANTGGASGVREKTGFGRSAAAAYADRFQVTKAEERPLTEKRQSHEVDINPEEPLTTPGTILFKVAELLLLVLLVLLLAY